MDTNGVDLLGRRRRRRHSAEFKAKVIAKCRQPGVSIAGMALAHGLNANMLRKWVIEAEARSGAEAVKPGVTLEGAEPQRPAPSFVPLGLPSPCEEATMRIELHRAGTTVNVTWPVAAASECAAWMRELLR